VSISLCTYAQTASTRQEKITGNDVDEILAEIAPLGPVKRLPLRKRQELQTFFEPHASTDLKPPKQNPN
jgi:hypothetical protein